MKDCGKTHQKKKPTQTAVVVGTVVGFAVTTAWLGDVTLSDFVVAEDGGLPKKGFQICLSQIENCKRRTQLNLHLD